MLQRIAPDLRDCGSVFNFQKETLRSIEFAADGADIEVGSGLQFSDASTGKHRRSNSFSRNGVICAAAGKIGKTQGRELVDETGKEFKRVAAFHVDTASGVTAFQAAESEFDRDACRSSLQGVIKLKFLLTARNIFIKNIFHHIIFFNY